MPENTKCLRKRNLICSQEINVVQQQYSPRDGKYEHPEKKLPEQGRYNFVHFLQLKIYFYRKNC
jgi:hypothetical protein